MGTRHQIRLYIKGEQAAALWFKFAVEYESSDWYMDFVRDELLWFDSDQNAIFFEADDFAWFDDDDDAIALQKLYGEARSMWQKDVTAKYADQKHKQTSLSGQLLVSNEDTFSDVQDYFFGDSPKWVLEKIISVMP